MDAIERRNRASAEAADWWALLQGDAMTRAERESFIDWLRDSQTNVAEMLRLAQVHGALEQFREWADIRTDRPSRDGQSNVVPLPVAAPLTLPREVRGENGRGLRLIAIAATLAAITLIATFLVPHFRGQSIVTERGERREVVLDDGSMVKVDPQTRLRVQFEQGVRRVRLIEGRAVFRVAKDATRPFLVDAGDTTVRAVGTAFGVEQRDGNVVVVTVSEGRVAVSSSRISTIHAGPKASSELPIPFQHSSPSGGEGPEVRTPPSAKHQGEVLLAADEQITVAAAGSSQPVRNVQSERELAWADGRLVFRKDPISKVVTEFNRYNRVQLIVSDAALAARPVTGVFDAANPEAFIAFLQIAASIQIERDESRSILIEPSVSH